MLSALKLIRPSGLVHGVKITAETKLGARLKEVCEVFSAERLDWAALQRLGTWGSHSVSKTWSALSYAGCCLSLVHFHIGF